MPVIATCPRCTARFVADEAASADSRAGPATQSVCETCHRKADAKRLGNSRTSFHACVGATMFLTAKAIQSVRHPRQHERMPWQGLLGTAAACGALGVFYYFCRVRPQAKLVFAALEADEERRESPDVRRLRRLREAGHPIDLKREHRVLRKQAEWLTEDLVDSGYLNYDELRQERRRNRLLDRIDEVDEQLERLADQVETSGADRATLDELERRRSRLTAELARPPSVWPRIVDGSVTLIVGFFELVLLFAFVMFAVAAFRAGKFGMAALITALLLAKFLPVGDWWRAWCGRRSHPTGCVSDRTAETD